MSSEHEDKPAEPTTGSGPSADLSTRPGKGDTVLSGIAWTVARTFGIAVIQFGVMVVLSRFLTLEELGWATAAITISNFAGILAQIGVAPAIVQRPVITHAHIATGMIVSVVTGLLQSSIVFFAAPMIAQAFGAPAAVNIIRGISLTFAISALSRISLVRLSRDMRFKPISRAELASTVLYGVVATVGAVLGYGAWSIVWAVVVQAASRTVLLMVGEPMPRPFRFSPEAFKDLMTVGRGFSAATVLNYIAREGDKVVIGRFLGAAPLGLYSRAYEMMQRPASMIALSVNRVLFPAMSRKQDDKAQLSQLYLRTSVGLASIVIPVGWVFAVLGPELIRGLLGQKFDAAVLPFQILASGMIFRIGFQSSDAITKAVGDAAGRVVPRIVYVAAVFGLGIAGTRWGITGVAVGVLVANILHTSLMAVQSQKHVDFGWGHFFKAHRGPVVLGVVSSLAAFVGVLPSRVLGLPLLLGLACGLTFAIIAGAALLLKGNESLLGPTVLELRRSILKRSKKGKKKEIEAEEAAAMEAAAEEPLA